MTPWRLIAAVLAAPFPACSVITIAGEGCVVDRRAGLVAYTTPEGGGGMRADCTAAAKEPEPEPASTE